MRTDRRNLQDLSRSIGGVLVVLGAVVLLSRETGGGESHEIARVLITLIPAILLYLLATGLLERSEDERGQPWRAVLLVSSLLLAPVGALELLHWLGADTNNALYELLVFALTAILAGWAGRIAQVPYAMLLAGISALVAWEFLWSKILDSPSASTERWLLVVAAVLLLGSALGLARRGALGAGEIAISGALAAVAAGVLGIFVSLFAAAAKGITEGIQAGGGGLFSPHFASHPSGVQNFGWDLYLLLVSLAFVLIAGRGRNRGLGYVGVAGLLGFLLSVGVQVTRLAAGHARLTGIGGWPIVLLVVGAVALLLPELRRRPA
jgi:hypothetical protein